MKNSLFQDILNSISTIEWILETTNERCDFLTPEQNEILNQKLHNINRIRP